MPFRTSRNSSWFDFGEFLKYAKNEFEMGSSASSPSNDASVPPTWSIHYWSDRYETSYRCSLPNSLGVNSSFFRKKFWKPVKKSLFQKKPSEIFVDMPISYQFPQPGAFIIGHSYLQIHMDAS